MDDTFHSITRAPPGFHHLAMEESTVSHPLHLSDAQRACLAAADVDAAALTRAIAASRRAETPFTALQWLAAASLAAAVADRLDQVVNLANHPAGREPWASSARRVHDTAARFELWAELADAGLVDVADAGLADTGAVEWVAGDAAHDAA